MIKINKHKNPYSDKPGKVQSKNPYLDDKKRGIDLVARLMKFKESLTFDLPYLKKIDDILNVDFIKAVSPAGITDEIKLYSDLQHLRARIFERNKLIMLDNKSVVGIGGKFSSGKSCFINSILKKQLLPEDQTPTTSIPTYIVASNNDDISAYTYSNNDVKLTITEAQALTHSFYDEYGLGFTEIISNLVFNIKGFKYLNVALLDTPGYTKDDFGLQANSGDYSKAQSQLKSADFIIWLIDIENGTIPQSDLNFLLAVAPENPVLIIFNKCDKKTDEDISKILEHGKNILDSYNIPIFDLIPYSSVCPEKFDKNHVINNYIKKANNYVNQKQNFRKCMEYIYTSVMRELTDALDEKEREEKKIGIAIENSINPIDIKALVLVYSEMKKEINTINRCFHSMALVQNNFNDNYNELVKFKKTGSK